MSAHSELYPAATASTEIPGPLQTAAPMPLLQEAPMPPFQEAPTLPTRYAGTGSVAGAIRALEPATRSYESAEHVTAFPRRRSVDTRWEMPNGVLPNPLPPWSEVGGRVLDACMPSIKSSVKILYGHLVA
jgi:hypothetical protein